MFSTTPLCIASGKSDITQCLHLQVWRITLIAVSMLMLRQSETNHLELEDDLA
jgi:hypothetical protein